MLASTFGFPEWWQWPFVILILLGIPLAMIATMVLQLKAWVEGEQAPRLFVAMLVTGLAPAYVLLSSIEDIQRHGFRGFLYYSSAAYLLVLGLRVLQWVANWIHHKRNSEE